MTFTTPVRLLEAPGFFMPTLGKVGVISRKTPAKQ
jgi:hypothetical protein|tara:strand:- start:15950 stop:16054 length:105 start_codon:yes stop_codon:yes gene_type:complete